MIQGTNKNTDETAYREIVLDSSSSLKEFSLDRKKYYRKYILHEEVEDKDTNASIMGRLVETLLWQKQLFDMKFYMSSCYEAPTGMMLAFVEALYDISRDATDEDGKITMSFDEMCKEAYIRSGYKISYERVMSNFIGGNAEIYYNEIRTVRSKGLTVVTAEQVNTAEKIVDELKNNQFIGDVVNLMSGPRYSVTVQFQIENYELDGLPFKSMLDLFVVDHVKQTIQIYDLKCVWAVENFYEEYYLYRRAYMQAYLYYKAAHYYKNEVDEELSDYKVLPPKFIVSDSSNYYSPLIYTMTEYDLHDAYEGFEFKGRKYSGVKSTIKDLKWALEHNIWNISRENYESGAIIPLKP
jgi:hypothetical protein